MTSINTFYDKKGGKSVSRAGSGLKRLALLLTAFSLLLTVMGGCEKAPERTEGWHASWGMAAQQAGDSEIPTTVSLKENTLRQLITPTLGGDKLRLTISNEYGSIPMIIDEVHIAKADGLGSSKIDTSTDTVLSFSGSSSVTIEPGVRMTSDELSFSVSSLEPLAVTIKFGKYTGGGITCHSTANTTCWIAEGDHVSDETMPQGETKSCWYFITGLDVWADAEANTIVCLGDSITDGVGAAYDNNTSWPDYLSSHLSGQNTSVINMGISGNILSGDWGVKSRLERDVLSIPGVTHCFLLIGINDIGGSTEDITDRLIADYKEILERCHEAGIKVYACSMTPIKGSGYYSELHETIRVNCNEFLLSEDNGFDGVVDFSSAIAREDDPSQMKDEYNCSWGDFLHPGVAGYDVMGELAYEKFLEFNS